MKLLYSLLLTFIFIVATAQKGQKEVSLNGDWKFKTDPTDKGESLQWYGEHADDRQWDSIPVPGNWDLRNEYAHYAGKAWYRKNFTATAGWKGKTVRLVFEGVNWNSKVWVNGRLVATNNIGYMPFEADISSGLHPGSNNSIVVQADNTFRVGALWNWGGIRRPVRLLITEKAFVSGQHITPSVDLQNHTARITVSVSLQNNAAVEKKLDGAIALSSPDGFKKTLPFTVAVPAGGSKVVAVQTSISGKEMHLWNSDDPFLYESAVSVSGQPTAIKDRFGLRKIEIDNKNYTIKLNGEVIRPMGFNLVPDDRTTGSTLPLWRVMQDVDLLKTMGANMARLTHLPLHKEMFDYLDEKGILVFSEIPLWGLDQLVDKNNPVPKQWLQRLVNTNYNHPCIVGWSVGNEIGDSPGVMEYVEDAIDFVKRTDTSRLAVMISHTAQRGKDPLQYSDLGFINRYGVNIGSAADKIHALHPEKVLFYSEYGYGQLSEDLDGDVDARGMLDSIRFKPYLVGGSLWTFNDYRSNFSGTKEFSENRPWGIVDVFRQKKQAWYSFRKQYAPIRNIQVEMNSADAHATITIVPRKRLDLPAYSLKDYLLVWQGFDNHHQLIQGGAIQLPVIMPGDKDISHSIHWEKGKTFSSLTVELLSPLNYSVYDTTVCFTTPDPPVVTYLFGGRTSANDTGGSNGSVKIVFDRKQAGVYYKAKYGVDGLTQETPPTLNSFIEIPKLVFGQTYQVAVAGVNAMGEGKPSEIKTVKVEAGLAAPTIYYVEPADKGFYIGYGTANNDYMFIVQYTTKSGDYTNAPVLQTPAKGVLFVPGLVNGQRYFFRISRIKDNNYRTGWSEEHEVMPDGHQLPAKPVVRGLIRNETEAVLVFEAVRKATGYTIQYKVNNSNQWTSVRLNATELTHYRIKGISANAKLACRISSENGYGRSAFSNVQE